MTWAVSLEQANEALADPDTLVFDPDYASQSSQRPHNWVVASRRAGADGDLAEAGVIYGVNGWPANDADTRR